MKEGVFLIRIRFKAKLILIFIIIILLLIATFFSSLYIRKTVINYGNEQATTIVFNSANKALTNYLAKSEITYEEIVKLSRNSNNDISSLEIDIVKINALKSNVTSIIADSLAEKERYELSIPIGTLFGNEFSLGLGPEVKFRMQMVSTVITDFESNFYSAGINQVLHQILIKVNVNGSLIMPWCKQPFYVETSVIAAQTVLVGITPEAYTNVIENYNRGEDGLVGDIFDYSATTK